MPLSKEMHQDKLKASSVIAVGPPGTGKSQLASHLLNQKNFEYEGQKFTLNANVVPLNIMNL